MLQALCTWQRWIGVWRPKVWRIALLSALAPSMMNNRQTFGSKPRSTRLSSSACATAAFSAAPSITARGCLPPTPVNADGGQQHQIIGDVDAVDLDRQQVQPRQVARHPLFHALGREGDKATRRRRLGKAGAMTGRDVAFWKPHRAAELAGRDIDQHQVQRPLAEPILGYGCLPAR